MFKLELHRYSNSADPTDNVISFKPSLQTREMQQSRIFHVPFPSSTHAIDNIGEKLEIIYFQQTFSENLLNPRLSLQKLYSKVTGHSIICWCSDSLCFFPFNHLAPIYLPPCTFHRMKEIYSLKLGTSASTAAANCKKKLSWINPPSLSWSIIL